MRCGQTIMSYATRHHDIAAEFNHDVLLKILEFPEEAAVCFMNQLTVENSPLTVSMGDYDHLP